MKKRKGSLLLVITFGSLMAWVIVSMLQLATTLYSATKDSAQVYSDIQTYRAAAEIACYQYISDLQGVTVKKDLDADWISVTGQALYTQAIDTIQGQLADATDPTAWFVSDISTAVSGASISNPAVLTDLLGRLSGVRQTFKLTIPEPIRLDWSDPDSWSSRNGAYVALEPFKVTVDLSVRGEELFEEFIVDGLYLDLTKTKSPGLGGGTTTIATMFLSEKESGVQITRETAQVS